MARATMPLHTDSGLMTALQPTARSFLRRSKERAAIDREALHTAPFDGMCCHFGVIVRRRRVVRATAYGVDLDRGPDGEMYLHGSVAARSVVAVLSQTVC